jgi:hypothetical protein
VTKKIENVHRLRDSAIPIYLPIIEEYQIFHPLPSDPSPLHHFRENVCFPPLTSQGSPGLLSYTVDLFDTVSILSEYSVHLKLPLHLKLSSTPSSNHLQKPSHPSLHFQPTPPQTNSTQPHKQTPYVHQIERSPSLSLPVPVPFPVPVPVARFPANPISWWSYHNSHWRVTSHHEDKQRSCGPQGYVPGGSIEGDLDCGGRRF